MHSTPNISTKSFLETLNFLDIFALKKISYEFYGISLKYLEEKLPNCITREKFHSALHLSSRVSLFLSPYTHFYTSEHCVPCTYHHQRRYFLVKNIVWAQNCCWATISCQLLISSSFICGHLSASPDVFSFQRLYTIHSYTKIEIFASIGSPAIKKKLKRWHCPLWTTSPTAEA